MTAPCETTACRLTGQAPSAICVIELAGPKAKSWIDRYWQPASGVSDIRIDAIRYGQIQFDATVGESIVVCRTADQRYELHCHGGKVAAQAVLDAMADDGIVIQSMDAWCHDHHEDPIIAKATMALLQAKTLRTARILLEQQQGALSRAISVIDLAIQSGDHSRARELFDQLRSWDHVGTHLVTPFEILLGGPPNVGKSSLLNRILGYQRAIVHEQAGTTRDLLAEESSIDGWPVRLKDSAGIRTTSDAIEQAGVERAIVASRSADLQLILVDPVEGWVNEHQRLFDWKPTQSMIVVTKFDRHNKPIDAVIESPALRSLSIQVSAVTGYGIPELLGAISRRLVPVSPPPGQAVVFDESLRRALEARFA